MILMEGSLGYACQHAELSLAEHFIPQQSQQRVAWRAAHRPILCHMYAISIFIYGLPLATGPF